MPIGNVTIQRLSGPTTIGVIPASGFGFSFLNPLYRYANLTLPYSPNDPALSYTYNNSSLAPTVLLYARFFNLLNESSVAIVANVGTSAFTVSGGPSLTGAQDCLDVRGFGAVGDGVTDDTGAIQAALNKAYTNYLGNQIAVGQTSSQNSQPVQSTTGHIENGSGGTLALSLPTTPTLNNTLILTFTAFDYGGGPNSPASPTVTDNNGNSWVQASRVQNGENLLYTYYAKVASASATTVTISMPQRQFNSFIAAILTEFTSLLVPITVDGTASAVIASQSSFTPIPSLAPTNNGDLVVYSVSFDFAAGITPVPPGDFILVASSKNPQPNGLNGAVPVTAQAYRNWSGKTTINTSWQAAGYAGGAAMVAFRQVALAPAPPGKTTVCIPAGVNCMVSPLPAFDHAPTDTLWNLPSSLIGSRYQSMAYSLVMNDGVTLRIDGSLIANPNANSNSIAGGLNLGGEFGWMLITNSAWLTNSTLATQLVSTGLSDPVIPWNSYTGGTAFNEGPRNKGIRITGLGQVFLNGQVQANLPTDIFDGTPCGFPTMGLARFYCVDNSTIDNLELLNPWGMAIEWGHSTGVKIDNLYIHDAPNRREPEVGTPSGIIEMDMLRNSKITNNTTVNCPRSIGLIDWAGYQGTISGNKWDNCFGGYQYWDSGGEWGWTFEVPIFSGVASPGFGGLSYTNVTHNTEITQNTAINCIQSTTFVITTNQSAGGQPVSYDKGSDGFGFMVGRKWDISYIPSQYLVLPVTGTGLHDNIASGNISDAFYSSLTAFRSLSNNSFAGGGGTVANGVNTVTGEVPGGAINGSNKVFILAHIPSAGTVVMFLNGLQQTSGTDFTVSGNTVTMTVAPNPGSTLTSNYQFISGN